MVFIPPTTERTCRCSSCDFVFATATMSEATLVFCPSCGIQFLLRPIEIPTIPTARSLAELPEPKEPLESCEHHDAVPSAPSLALPEQLNRSRRRHWYYRCCLLLAFAVQVCILFAMSVAAFHSYKQSQQESVSLHTPPEQLLSSNNDSKSVANSERETAPLVPPVAPVVESPKIDTVTQVTVLPVKPSEPSIINTASPPVLPSENTVETFPEIPYVVIPPIPPIANQHAVIPPLPAPAIEEPPSKTISITTIINREDRQKLIKQAEEMVVEAKRLRSTDLRKSLELILSALTTFRQQGYPMASSLTWLLSQVLAEQSLGLPIETASTPTHVMAVSPDNLWLLTGNADNTVFVRHLRHQDRSGDGFFLDRGPSPVVKVLYTPSHTWMIWGLADGTIRLSPTMSQKTGSAYITLPERVEGLRNIVVSPDDRWLVAFGGNETTQSAESFDGTVSQRRNFMSPVNVLRQTWSRFAKKYTVSGIVQTSFEEPTTTGIAFETRNNERFQNTVYLWDLSRLQNDRPGQPILLRGHERPVRSAAVSSDSRWLITGSEDGSVRVFDLRSIYPGAEQTVLKGHHLDVTTIAIAPNNKWFATGSRDNTIRLWSMPHLNASHDPVTLEGHVGWVSRLAIDAKGENILSSSYDNTVRKWSVPRGRIEAADHNATVLLDNVQGAVTDLLSSSDGSELYSLGTDGSLCIRSVWNNDEIIQLKSDRHYVTGMSLTADGRWLVLRYVNENDPSQSGVSLWPLRLDDLMKVAESALAAQ